MRIFRPYRDVRFSKDKSPYKTNIAAVIGDGYVSLSARGLGAGVGMWQMAPDQLVRYRAAVDANATGGRLERVVADIRGDGRRRGRPRRAEDRAEGLPEGPPADRAAPVQGNRRRGSEWPAAAWLGTSRAKDRVVELFRVGKPLNAWLDEERGTVHRCPTGSAASNPRSRCGRC